MFIKLLIVFIIISEVQSQCPPEYISYRNESCFAVKYVDPPISFFEAMQICNNINGFIASVDDATQEDWLINHVTLIDDSDNYVFYWLGLVRNISNKDQWFWLDNNKSQYKNWVYHESFPTEDDRSCSVLNYNGWHIVDCDLDYRGSVICRAVHQKIPNNNNNNTSHSNLENNYLAWAATVTILLVLLICALTLFFVRKHILKVKTFEGNLFFFKRFVESS